MAEEMMTLQEAAKYLKISDRTLWRYVQARKIGCITVGRRYRFTQTILDEYIKANTVKAIK